MKKTKRRYTAKVYKTKVDMKEAVQELSPNAFMLLNLIYHGVLDGVQLEDGYAMTVLGVSRRPYFKAKEELKEKGFIRVVQVGSTKYKWFIGKKAIQRDADRYDRGKKLKKDLEFAKLTLGCTNKDNFTVINGEGIEELEVI